MIVLVDQVGDPMRESGAEGPAEVSGPRRLLGPQDRLRPILVVDAQATLEDVGERAVADVVDQRGGQQRLAALARRGIVAGDPAEVLERLLHQVDHAQAVAQPVVIGAGIGQVADPQLMDSAKPLDLGAVEQLEQPPIPLAVDADVVIQGIADDLRGHDRLRSISPRTGGPVPRSSSRSRHPSADP